MDASAEIAALARRRLGDRADVWCQNVLDLDLDAPVDAIIPTAKLHWVTDQDRLWARLAQALQPGGVLEIQCAGEGNIARVREVIEAVARDTAPELVGWSPPVFPGPHETQRRVQEASRGVGAADLRPGKPGVASVRSTLCSRTVWSTGELRGLRPQGHGR